MDLESLHFCALIFLDKKGSFISVVTARHSETDMVRFNSDYDLEAKDAHDPGS